LLLLRVLPQLNPSYATHNDGGIIQWTQRHILTYNFDRLLNRLFSQQSIHPPFIIFLCTVHQW
jgi:hypothetical protein